MTTAEIKAMATKYIINTYGDRKLALVRGEGPYVWDADGAKYLDFLGGLAVNGLGHCHPNVVAALREQAGKLLHVSNLYYIEPQAKLAQLLIDRQLRYGPVLLLQQRRGSQRVRNQAGAEVCQRSGKNGRPRDHHDGEFVPRANDGDDYGDRSNQIPRRV